MPHCKLKWDNHNQRNSEKFTEFLTIGSLQIGIPIVKQQWIDEFLASRRQGLSEQTLELYRDTLYQAIGIELTTKGINNWLANVTKGNAKLSYYRAMKAFCNWLYKSRKITKNPITLVDRPNVSKKLLPERCPGWMSFGPPVAGCFSPVGSKGRLWEPA